MSDSRELGRYEPVAAPVRQSDDLLAQVIAAAKDPTVDAAKMETLARLVNSQQDREREIEFNIAKNAAIQAMPVITKDGRIIIRKPGEREREQGRFARFEDIDRVCRPILQRNNLAITFEMNERQGGGITVTPILSHANGMTERGGAFPVPPETSGSKNAAQAMGSSAAYGKRYAYCAMLNIVTEGVDDDGNGGRGQIGAALPFEREQAVRADAAAAAEQGHYQEWFSTQSPKDRSWLISSGLHAEYGGQTQIAPPKPDPIVIDESDRNQDDSTPPPADDGKRKRSPEEMVEAWEARLGTLKTKDELLEAQAVPATVKWMDGLREKHPALHQRVVDANARRYSELVAQGDQPEPTGGDKLL